MNSLKLLNSRLLGLLSRDVKTEFVNIVLKCSSESNDVAIQFTKFLGQRISPKSKTIPSKIVKLDGSAVTLVKTFQETFDIKHSVQTNEKDFRSQAVNKPSKLRSSSDFDIDVERGSTTLGFFIVRKALRMPSIRCVITRTYCTKSEPTKKPESVKKPEPIEKPHEEMTYFVEYRGQRKIIHTVPLSLLLEERALRAKVEEKLETAEKKMMILAVRSRIEDLQNNLLWPRSVSKPNSRRSIFREILTSQRCEFTDHPNVIEFRKLFMGSGFSVDFFLDTLNHLYGEFSDRAAHHVPFPKEIRQEFIEQMFWDIGLTPDQPRIAAVYLIIKPLPFNPKKLKDKL